MPDFEDAENILNLYARQTEGEISELSKTIIALRSKVTLVTEQLESEKNRAKNIPIPPTVISQLANLKSENLKLKNDLALSQKSPLPLIVMSEIANYKTKIAKMSETIAQYEKLNASTKTTEVLLGQIDNMKAQLLEKDAKLSYYKTITAQQSDIINKEIVPPSTSVGLEHDNN